MLSNPLNYKSWKSQSVCHQTFDILLHIPHYGIEYRRGSREERAMLEAGAEKWVDFRETKDLVKDIKDATGEGRPHAALVARRS